MVLIVVVVVVVVVNVDVVVDVAVDDVVTVVFIVELVFVVDNSSNSGFNVIVSVSRLTSARRLAMKKTYDLIRL